jgi:hypothetical protein
MEYREYLKTEDWQAKRDRKLSRKKLCGICAAPIVDIHHLNYKNLFDVEMTDLRRMCRRCHFLAHDLHKIGKILFTSTNHHSRWAIIKSAVKKELGLTKVNMFLIQAKASQS